MVLMFLLMMVVVMVMLLGRIDEKIGKILIEF
jgi:hypothetical protein